jgi:hypothetical protein
VLYDPFVERALEPWSYGIYAGGQSILVGTPVGVTFAPEGGAHQSIKTPSIGLEQPGCVTYRPLVGTERLEQHQHGHRHRLREYHIGRDVAVVEHERDLREDDLPPGFYHSQELSALAGPVAGMRYPCMTSTQSKCSSG